MAHRKSSLSSIRGSFRPRLLVSRGDQQRCPRDLCFGLPERLCPLCQVTLFNHISCKKHVFNHSLPLVNAHSKCATECSSIYSAAGHFRNCTGRPKIDQPPADDLSFRCTSCHRSFSTNTGLSLHIKRSHPVEFYERINTTRFKARWSEEETRLLAVTEAALAPNTSSINEALAAHFPGHSIEAIKGKRKQPAYRETLYNIKQSPSSNWEDHPGASTSNVLPTSLEEETVPLNKESSLG